MPHTPQVKVAGKITEVFGHRFVIMTDKGKVLADIGPEAAGRITLDVSETVEIEGEQKPTEVKVHRISLDGGRHVAAHHAPERHDAEHGPFDSVEAKHLAERNGFKIIGKLSPHKKHYEAEAVHGGERHDIHVHRDHIMKKYKVR